MFRRLVVMPGGGLSPERIRKLTRAQVRELYLCRRDEWGNVRDDDEKPPGGGREEALRLLCVERGWPDWLAEKWLARQGGDDGPFSREEAR